MIIYTGDTTDWPEGRYRMVYDDGEMQDRLIVKKGTRVTYMDLTKLLIMWEYPNNNRVVSKYVRIGDLEDV